MYDIKYSPPYNALKVFHTGSWKSNEQAMVTNPAVQTIMHYTEGEMSNMWEKGEMMRQYMTSDVMLMFYQCLDDVITFLLM